MLNKMNILYFMSVAFIMFAVSRNIVVKGAASYTDQSSAEIRQNCNCICDSNITFRAIKFVERRGGGSFLLYNRGINHTLWCIVLRHNGSYITYFCKDSHMDFVTHLDSIVLYDNAIFDWAFNDMSDVKYRIPEQGNMINTTSIELFDLRENNCFYINEYYCTDNKDVNTRLEQLFYLLYWLSSPNVREYLPMPKVLYNEK